MHDHAHASYGSHAHALEGRRDDSRRRMRVALAINVALLAAEAIGGVLTGSLAVLADAGHLLSDVGSIVAGPGRRPARLPPRRRPSHLRLPALGGARGARSTGLLLIAVGLGIAVAAVGRLAQSAGDRRRQACWRSGALGLAGNLAATLVLARGQRQDINLEGVLRHSAADALGSLGVVIAGAGVLAGGSPIVDPIVGLLISVLILASSWRLIKEPFDVLMEAAPPRDRRRRAGRSGLRRGGGPLGPRPARLDGDRRLRRNRRPCSRRPWLRPRSGPPPA